MSVLIKGIDMPTGCVGINIKIWPDGEVEIVDQDREWKTAKAIPVYEEVNISCTCKNGCARPDKPCPIKE